jgi:hypothetical protein
MILRGVGSWREERRLRKKYAYLGYYKGWS